MGYNKADEQIPLSWLLAKGPPKRKLADADLKVLKSAISKFNQYLKDTEVTKPPAIHSTHDLPFINEKPPVLDKLLGRGRLREVPGQRWLPFVDLQRTEEIKDKMGRVVRAKTGEAKTKKLKPLGKDLVDAFEGDDVAATLRNVEAGLWNDPVNSRKAMSRILEHPEAGKLRPRVVAQLAPTAYENWAWGINKNLQDYGDRADDVGVMARNAAAALKKGNLAAANAFSAATFTASKGYNFERMEEAAHAYLRGETVEPTTPLNVRQVVDEDLHTKVVGKTKRVPTPYNWMSHADAETEQAWMRAQRKAEAGDPDNPPGSRDPEDVIVEEERGKLHREEFKAAKKRGVAGTPYLGPQKQAGQWEKEELANLLRKAPTGNPREAKLIRLMRQLAEGKIATKEQRLLLSKIPQGKGNLLQLLKLLRLL